MKVRSIHLFLVAGILVLSGYVHGKWSNRWVAASAIEGKDLLGGLESEVGDWRPGEFFHIDPADVPAKTACRSRRFQPLKTGKEVVVSITSGSPGVVAVHTPDVCYLGAGYKLRGAVTRQSIPLADGKNASLWMADFVKTSATGAETIRVRWSWTADGDWQAPDYPRWVLARAPVLYKLYFVHAISEEEDLTREDPYRKFVADLIPTLNAQLGR